MSQTIVLETLKFDGDVKGVENSVKTVSEGSKALDITAKMDVLEVMLKVYEDFRNLSKTTKSYLKSDMKKMRSAASEMERTDQFLFVEP